MRKFSLPVRLGLLILLGMFLSGLARGEEVVLQLIEMNRDRGYDYLDVYTSGRTEAKGLLLEDKLYIDFPWTVVGKNLKITKRPSKRIASIKVVQKDSRTARVIISLKKSIDYEIVNVFGWDKTVVEIGDRMDNVFTGQFSWESSSLEKKGEVLKPVELAPSAAAKLPLHGQVIILDPGHGGDDPGANPLSSTPEKILTLKTAQAVADRLQKEGAKVYLTRNEDRRSNLRDVVDFANKTKADLFISLHYNSTYNSGIAGTETYYYNPESRRFAEIMHEAIIRGIKQKDRGLHRVRFYTVSRTEMPSVLIEPIYLSNPDENNLANSEAFREKLAAAVVKGINNYVRNNRH